MIVEKKDEETFILTVSYSELRRLLRMTNAYIDMIYHVEGVNGKIFLELAEKLQNMI